jgi:hypothetical protein
MHTIALLPSLEKGRQTTSDVKRYFFKEEWIELKHVMIVSIFLRIFFSMLAYLYVDKNN